MNNQLKWETIASQFVLDDPWCQIRRDTVKLPNGKIIDDFFVNVRSDVVLILAITKDKKVVFVRQYRHAVQEILLELPGGSFKPELEDSLKAAARELKEETGYVAKCMTQIATLYDNPVKDTNKIHLVLAEDVLLAGPQQLDPTEDINIILIPLEEIPEKISKGEIVVSGTIAALFLGLKFLRLDNEEVT